jgi:co-chaperonin GroES (HSP10)
MTTLGNSVLILPDKLPEKTRNGVLVIPQNSKEMLPGEGVVIQVGPACEQVKAGNHVKFNRKPASVIIIDEIEHYLVEEHNILYHE